MKTKLLLIFIFSSLFLFAQDSIKYTEEARLIAFTPLHKIDKVNGIAIGIGMDEIIRNNVSKKTINGLNIDINLIGFLLFCFYDTAKIVNSGDVLQQNGINISLAGFLRNNSHNGINVSLYNYGNKMNGVSVAVIGNVVEEINGVYIGGMSNYAEKGRGVTIGVFNEVKEFKGLQIGIRNKSDNMKGIQIGLWNVNGKRKLPIINWNFKNLKS